MRAIVVVLVAAFGLTAIAVERNADVTEIEALYQTWRTAVEASDISGYVALLHDEVRLLPPGASAIEGAADYAAFLEPVFATATYRIDVHQHPAVDVRGNVAVAEYVYTIHLELKNPDVAVSEPGALTESSTTARYLDVLLKDAGEWRVWRHGWQAYQASQ